IASSVEMISGVGAVNLSAGSSIGSVYAMSWPLNLNLNVIAAKGETRASMGVDTTSGTVFSVNNVTVARGVTLDLRATLQSDYSGRFTNNGTVNFSKFSNGQTLFNPDGTLNKIGLFCYNGESFSYQSTAKFGNITVGGNKAQVAWENGDVKLVGLTANLETLYADSRITGIYNASMTNLAYLYGENAFASLNDTFAAAAESRTAKTILFVGEAPSQEGTNSGTFDADGKKIVLTGNAITLGEADFVGGGKTSQIEVAGAGAIKSLTSGTKDAKSSITITGSDEAVLTVTTITGAFTLSTKNSRKNFQKTYSSWGSVMGEKGFKETTTSTVTALGNLVAQYGNSQVQLGAISGMKNITISATDAIESSGSLSISGNIIGGGTSISVKESTTYTHYYNDGEWDEVGEESTLYTYSTRAAGTVELAGQKTETGTSIQLSGNIGAIGGEEATQELGTFLNVNLKYVTGVESNVYGGDNVLSDSDLYGTENPLESRKSTGSFQAQSSMVGNVSGFLNVTLASGYVKTVSGGNVVGKFESPEGYRALTGYTITSTGTFQVKDAHLGDSSAEKILNYLNVEGSVLVGGDIRGGNRFNPITDEDSFTRGYDLVSTGSLDLVNSSVMGDIVGYQTMTMQIDTEDKISVVNGSIMAGNRVYTNKFKASDYTPENGVDYVVSLEDYTMAKKTVSTMSEKAAGSALLKFTSVSGQLFGYQTVTLFGSVIEEAVTGGVLTKSATHLVTPQSGTSLYDNSFSSETASNEKHLVSTGALLAEATTLSSFSGYAEVNLTGSTLTDITSVMQGGKYDFVSKAQSKMDAEGYSVITETKTETNTAAGSLVLDDVTFTPDGNGVDDRFTFQAFLNAEVRNLDGSENTPDNLTFLGGKTVTKTESDEETVITQTKTMTGSLLLADCSNLNLEVDGYLKVQIEDSNLLAGSNFQGFNVSKGQSTATASFLAKNSTLKKMEVNGYKNVDLSNCKFSVNEELGVRFLAGGAKSKLTLDNVVGAVNQIGNYQTVNLTNCTNLVVRELNSSLSGTTVNFAGSYARLDSYDFRPSGAKMTVAKGMLLSLTEQSALSIESLNAVVGPAGSYILTRDDESEALQAFGFKGTNLHLNGEDGENSDDIADSARTVSATEKSTGWIGGNCGSSYFDHVDYFKFGGEFAADATFTLDFDDSSVGALYVGADETLEELRSGVTYQIANYSSGDLKLFLVGEQETWSNSEFYQITVA
ncbi:MAG: hypothetical protein PHS41_11985, partial [Victivallaceae bacterium]|nr:hypothetical protein [Victivallaceae bacterium]